MAQSQCRPCEPRPVEGDVGDRELPHGGARRACRALRGLLATQIAYNSCRRHCPKCQGQPPKVARRARGRAVAGGVLSRRVHAAGADQRHRLPEQGRHLRHPVQGLGRGTDHDRGRSKALGARVGITSVLHSWGSAMTHHPHVHMIVPGGGISLDGSAGSRAGPASSCRCACSRACSAGCSWRSICTQTASVLRQSRSPRQGTDVRGLSGAAAQNRMGGLRKAPVRRAPGSARLSVALYPPRRHLQPPADRLRRPASPSSGRTIAPKVANGPR